MITGKDGSTMLTASILLGIMILPTVDRSHRIGASQRTDELITKEHWLWEQQMNAVCSAL